MTMRPRQGGYQVIVYAGIDPVTGRQRQIARQVKGKREAERLEAKLRAEVADGRHRGTSARTVGELLDVYLAWRETSGKPLSPATLNDYRTIVETKLKPALGKLRLPQLDPVTLDRFYGQLRRRGRNDTAALSTSRVRQVHAVLSGALGLAARYGWIGFNPARLARPPAAENDKRPVPTPAEVREVLAAAEQEDQVFGLFLRLCATTGLRAGEVCALRWCDLDLEAGELSVSGNVVHVSGLERGYVRKGPKSEHGMRLIALDPKTMQGLRAHQARPRARLGQWNDTLAEDAYYGYCLPSTPTGVRYLAGRGRGRGADEGGHRRSWWCANNQRSDGGRWPQRRGRSRPLAGGAGGVAGPGRWPVWPGGAPTAGQGVHARAAG
jgi:integrase